MSSQLCEWFALCTRPADGVVSHPILGWVPTCQRCADKLGLQLARSYDGILAPWVLIEEDTDPWVEVNGEPVDWTSSTLPRVPCPCGENGEVVEPGVLDGMNSPHGVQRCDACSTYDGDLDAALALARRVGGVARFYQSAQEVAR